MNKIKIIHQTWKNTNIPDSWKTSPILWKKHHPSWMHILWTDKDNRNLIKNHFPWFLEYFDGYEYNIQRADAVRYFILYKYGGIYCDLDIEPVFPIDFLVDMFFEKGYDLIFSKTPNVRGLTNSIMISRVEGHSFWKLMINEMINRFNKFKKIGKHMRVMYSTGPSLLTSVVHRANAMNIKVISHSYLHPASVKDKKPFYKKGSYMRILDGSSWVETDGKILIFLYSNLFKIIIIIIIFVIISIIIIKKTISNTKK